MSYLVSPFREPWAVHHTSWTDKSFQGPRNSFLFCFFFAKWNLGGKYNLCFSTWDISSQQCISSKSEFLCSFYFIKNINIYQDYLSISLLLSTQNTSSDYKVGSCKNIRLLSKDNTDKKKKANTPGHTLLQHLHLDYCWTMKTELWGRIQDDVHAKADLSFCLENMDQENWAGWTPIHLFPASASQQI